MRRLQWILSALVITLVFLICTPCPALLAKDKADKDILFRWAFGAMVGPEGDKRMVAITRDTTLKTGDKLKMLVELKNRCFVYLFYRTADDELYLLFPYALDQFEKDYETSKKYYIPEGDMWFRSFSPGSEVHSCCATVKSRSTTCPLTPPTTLPRSTPS